jgi:glucose-1-phosphate cytidylyltransferase
MTEYVPKALIPIGNKPMIWHILKLYAHYGYREFVLALGYKQDAFKQFFAHYDLINNDVTLNIGTYKGMDYREYQDRGWTVTLSDTGEDTMKGARLKRIEKYIQGDTFMCTYGDGIGDIDISSLLAFHEYHGKIVTITGVHPKPKYGEIHHENHRVISFDEKPVNDGCFVNGGFMVMSRKIFDYLIPDPQCDLERGVFELLAAKGEMMVFPHHGYWGAMDNLAEMHELDELWKTGQAKWKVWT